MSYLFIWVTFVVERVDAAVVFFVKPKQPGSVQKKNATDLDKMYKRPQKQYTLQYLFSSLFKYNISSELKLIFIVLYGD